MKLSQNRAYVVDDTGHIVPAVEIMAEVKRLWKGLAQMEIAARIDRDEIRRLRAEVERQLQRADNEAMARELAESEVERLRAQLRDVGRRS